MEGRTNWHVAGSMGNLRTIVDTERDECVKRALDNVTRQRMTETFGRQMMAPPSLRQTKVALPLISIRP